VLRSAPALEIAHDVILRYSGLGHFLLQARSNFFERFPFCLGALAAGGNVIANDVAVTSYCDSLVGLQKIGRELFAKLANADFQSACSFIVCTHEYTIIAGGWMSRKHGAAMIPQMSRRGKFITFEGLDGTGKSTQLRKLAAVLRAGGHKVIETREPGGTFTGEKIRKVLLDSSTAGLAPLAEMALMFASRAQHIAEVIEPALTAGSVVLCDRFTDSTEAYQGSGRRLGSEAVRELHRVLCGNLQPDLTILLDSDAGASVSRARRRNKRASKGAGRGHGDENRFEQETRAFFGRGQEG
jgi:dTMP kinase